MTNLLFNLGADVNMPDDGGNSPLHTATECANDACLEWLLNLNSVVSIESRNTARQTPLI